MRGRFRLAPSFRGAGLAAILLASLPGCQPAPPLANAGVSLTLPSSWRPVARTAWPVAGTPLAAWSGPKGSSLVIYRSLPIPGGKASIIAEGLGNRLANLPGLEVVAQGTETWDGWPAGRVEAVAPGDGETIAASGTGVPIARDDRPLIPTRRIIVGFPRASDTLYLAWHAPESASRELRAQVRATLEGMRLQAIQAARSSY